MWHTFDADVNADFAQIFDYSIGNRSDMAMRSAGRHDHIVAHGRSISKIDCEGVLGLHVVEAVEDQAEDLLGVSTHYGDRFGHATFGP
jgi:hypothetical protein